MVDAAEPETLVLTSLEPAGLPTSYPLVLRVEWDPNRLSANATVRMHWRTLRREQEAASVRFALAYREAGEPVWDVPVEVDVVAHRAARLDEDNLRSALKSGADVLFKQKRTTYVQQHGRKVGVTTERRALVPDDTPAWLEWGEIEQRIEPRWKGREWAELTIWPRVVLEARGRALERVLAEAVRVVDGAGCGVACEALRSLAGVVRDAWALGWRPGKGA